MKIRQAIGLIALVISMDAYSIDMVEQFTFSTTGNDCYADGTPVLTNECYAVVWRRNDKTFPGFTVIPPKPNDWDSYDDGFMVCGYYPRAVHELETDVSHCPRRTIPAGHYFTGQADKSTNGCWTVYLLDTRYFWDDGTIVCGFDSDETNMPMRINAYRPIIGLTDFVIPLTRVPFDSLERIGGDPSTPMIADISTILPSDLPTPTFSSISCQADDHGSLVRVSVTNTVPFCQYRLSVADEVEKMQAETNFVGEVKWGDETVPITWEIPLMSPAGFFKVFLLPSLVVNGTGI